MSTQRKGTLRGFVIYRGPSMLGHGNVVCVATLRTANRKTGYMVQIWILPDDGLSPLRAVQASQNAQALTACKRTKDSLCFGESWVAKVG